PPARDRGRAVHPAPRRAGAGPVHVVARPDAPAAPALRQRGRRRPRTDRLRTARPPEVARPVARPRDGRGGARAGGLPRPEEAGVARPRLQLPDGRRRPGAPRARRQPPGRVSVAANRRRVRRHGVPVPRRHRMNPPRYVVIANTGSLRWLAYEADLHAYW